LNLNETRFVYTFVNATCNLNIASLSYHIVINFYVTIQRTS